MFTYWSLETHVPVNTLRQRQIYHHFAVDFFKQISLNGNLFLRLKLTIFQHWFRWWLDVDQATSHYLRQWWSSLLTHICVTRSQWVVSDWFVIDSDNGLSPGRSWVIRWTNATLFSVRRSATNCTLYLKGLFSTQYNTFEDTVSIMAFFVHILMCQQRFDNRLTHTKLMSLIY